MNSPPSISSLHLPEQHFHFVTGKIAARGLTEYVSDVARRLGFAFSVDVLPISVAALMTPQWIAKRIAIPSATTAIILPGYCDNDLSPLRSMTQRPIYAGPKDFRLIEAMLTGQHGTREGYGDYSIEIIAEINHAPRLSIESIIEFASRYAEAGADVIDIGCEPGEPWLDVDVAVRTIRDLGLRVSIDSLNPAEISTAAAAGAELVLSVNSTNRDAAADWGCEVVAIPDEFKSMSGLEETMEFLTNANVPFRIDPILEPIGCGFSDSVVRYWHARTKFPNVEMMMGIGNLTELTDADSAGVNVLLLGICEELQIRSVLTTEVINWARSSVRECDLARRLVHYAISRGTVPKHIEPNLVMLRDTKLLPQTPSELSAIHANLRDPNYRIFAEDDALHVMNGNVHLQGDDAFDIFTQLMQTAPKNVNAEHAFYLGFEMAKALTARTLGKQYRQDQPLDWGMLTREEVSHRATSRRGPAPSDPHSSRPDQPKN